MIMRERDFESIIRERKGRNCAFLKEGKTKAPDIKRKQGDLDRCSVPCIMNTVKYLKWMMRKRLFPAK